MPKVTFNHNLGSRDAAEINEALRLRDPLDYNKCCTGSTVDVSDETLAALKQRFTALVSEESPAPKAKPAKAE